MGGVFIDEGDDEGYGNQEGASDCSHIIDHRWERSVGLNLFFYTAYCRDCTVYIFPSG